MSDQQEKRKRGRPVGTKGPAYRHACSEWHFVAAEMAAKGITGRAIGKVFGVSQQAVSSALRRLRAEECQP